MTRTRAWSECRGVAAVPERRQRNHAVEDTRRWDASRGAMERRDAAVVGGRTGGEVFFCPTAARQSEHAFGDLDRIASLERNVRSFAVGDRIYTHLDGHAPAIAREAGQQHVVVRGQRSKPTCLG